MKFKVSNGTSHNSPKPEIFHMWRINNPRLPRNSRFTNHLFSSEQMKETLNQLETQFELCQETVFHVSSKGARDLILTSCGLSQKLIGVDAQEQLAAFKIKAFFHICGDKHNHTLYFLLVPSCRKNETQL
jgi:hypothetical protein